MHDQLRTFVCKSARYRVLWRRCAPRVKSCKSLLCHFQREIIHLPDDSVDRIHITNNIQLSHKAVQGPSVELNKEVPVQACLQPLIFIIQMFSFHQQTVQNTDNGQALVEDDDYCKNRESFQFSEHRMLQVGDKMEERWTGEWRGDFRARICLFGVVGAAPDLSSSLGDIFQNVINNVVSGLNELWQS